MFQWYEGSDLAGVLELPQDVEWRATNFVAAAVDETGVLLFANGQSRRRDVRIGPVPAGGGIHLCNDANGRNQINGSAQFRVAQGRLRERHIRRLYRSRTLRLSDGELRFVELVSTTRAAVSRPL